MKMKDLKNTKIAICNPIKKTTNCNVYSANFVNRMLDGTDFTKLVTSGESLTVSYDYCDVKKSNFPSRLVDVINDTWNEFVSTDLSEFLYNEGRVVDVVTLEIWPIDFTIQFRFKVLTSIPNGNYLQHKYYWSKTPSVHQVMHFPKDEDEIDLGEYLKSKVTEIHLIVKLDDQEVKLYLDNIGGVAEPI